eukprot:s538_g6.t1
MSDLAGLAAILARIAWSSVEEDFAAPEADVGPALGRRGRGRGGPIDVTFSVFVHPAPAAGETVLDQFSIVPGHRLMAPHFRLSLQELGRLPRDSNIP